MICMVMRQSYPSRPSFKKQVMRPNSEDITCWAILIRVESQAQKSLAASRNFDSTVITYDPKHDLSKRLRRAYDPDALLDFDKMCPLKLKGPNTDANSVDKV